MNETADETFAGSTKVLLFSLSSLCLLLGGESLKDAGWKFTVPSAILIIAGIFLGYVFCVWKTWRKKHPDAANQFNKIAKSPRWWVAIVLILMLYVIVSSLVSFIKHEHVPSPVPESKTGQPTKNTTYALVKDAKKEQSDEDSEKIENLEKENAALHQKKAEAPNSDATVNDQPHDILDASSLQAFLTLTDYISGNVDNSKLAIAITAPPEHKALEDDLRNSFVRVCEKNISLIGQGWFAGTSAVLKDHDDCIKIYPDPNTSGYDKCMRSTRRMYPYKSMSCPVFFSPDSQNGKDIDARTLKPPEPPPKGVIALHHKAPSNGLSQDALYLALTRIFPDYNIQLGSKIDDDVKSLYHLPDDGYWIQIGTGSLLKTPQPR